MKGLYCQLSKSNEDLTFVFHDQESLPILSGHDVKLQIKACAFSLVNTKLLTELKLQKEFLPVGREIAGEVLEGKHRILPLDSEESGLCVSLLVHEHHLVNKPEKVSWVDAAGTIRDGLCAYMALHTLSHVGSGTTVLVIEGANPFGTIAIQLAHHRGAKVISTASNLKDKQYLEGLRPTVGMCGFSLHIARVIDRSEKKANLVDACLEETAGLGVDIVVDCGVQLSGKEDKPDGQQHLSHKHEILSLLAVAGHWVTTEENLQLDPPDSRMLFLKGATISFLNEEVWQMSSAQQGKYLHFLDIYKLLFPFFRPQLDEPIPLYEATVVMEMVQKNQAKKRQVVQL
uniref:Enoyl reductase (ER) domain-containing protein n=1 Tax=Callorhinchus milii TaxID=7868 RepID=A0A4W3JKQ6_CALMI